MTVTDEQFSRTILLQMWYRRKSPRSSGKIVFLPNGFKFDMVIQTNEGLINVNEGNNLH